jgi:hypothetical protein
MRNLYYLFWFLLYLLVFYGIAACSGDFLSVEPLTTIQPTSPPVGYFSFLFLSWALAGLSAEADSAALLSFIQTKASLPTALPAQGCDGAFLVAAVGIFLVVLVFLAVNQGGPPSGNSLTQALLEEEPLSKDFWDTGDYPRYKNPLDQFPDSFWNGSDSKPAMKVQLYDLIQSLPSKEWWMLIQENNGLSPAAGWATGIASDETVFYLLQNDPSLLLWWSASLVVCRALRIPGWS